MRTSLPVRQNDTWLRLTRRFHIGGLVVTMLIWLGALACIFPLLWTAVSSFRPDQSFLVSPFHVDPREWTLRNYQIIFRNDAFSTGFKSSAIQACIVLSTTLFFCPLAGYGFAKFRFRGRAVLFGVMMLTLFFVPLTQYIPLLIEMNAIGWVNTYQGLVIPSIISAFGVFYMTGVIAAVPDELVQAAQIDGCGAFSAWWRVVIPVIRPALVSLAVVTFLGVYNDYFWPLIILQTPSMQTIQVALALVQLGSDPLVPVTSFTSNFGPLLAGATVVVTPTIVIFLLMQRYFLRGVLEGSLKG